MSRLKYLLHLLDALRLVVLILLLVPGAAIASVTTGTIKGQAVDSGGLAMPGVLITIKSPNMMGFKQQETDAEGRFLFIELPPGNYELTAEMAGFTKILKPNLLVNIGRNTIVPLEMKVSSGSDEMIIEDSRPVIDTESGNVGSVLTKEFLERIPAGRSYQEAVQAAPGVTGGANPNVGGAAYNENTYLLDGVNITDPVTGTFSMNFSFDAIEQIEVLTTAFDPEYGVNLGGSINVVTRTGTNQLQHKVGVQYTNGNWSPRLDARYDADGLPLAPTDFDSEYQLAYVYGEVGGPIIRDKAWIYASYQMSRSLIANAGIPQPRDFDGHFLFSKITVQPSESHRFTFIGSADPSSIDNTEQGSRFIEPEAQGSQVQGGFVTSFQWDWYISPESFLETKATIQKSVIERHQTPCTHTPELYGTKFTHHACDPDELEGTVDYNTPARLGDYNAASSGNYVVWDFDDRWHGTLQSKFSLLQVEAAGTHDLKTGFNIEHIVWDKAFGVSGNMYYVDLNASDYNPDTYQNYYWVEYSGPFAYKTTADVMGAFIQDVYKPIDNLTFRYGVRYDRQIFRNDVGEPIISTGLWGPRFSTIWDPWGDGKTKVTGSVGRFNDTSRLGVADYLSESGLGAKLFLGEYFDGQIDAFNNEFSYNYSYDPITNTNYVLEGITAPRADSFVLGAEREVIPDLAVALNFTGKFTRNLYAFDETNFIWDQDGYNILGTNDGTIDTYYRLRTPNIARRDYYRTDFQVRRYLRDRWQTQGQYSYTISRGSVQTAPSGFLSVAPQSEYYLNAPLIDTDIRHDVWLGASWDIPDDPWTTQLGAVFNLESGYPLSRTYDASPVGDNTYSILKSGLGSYARTETWWNLNLRVEQKFPVKRGSLNAVAEVQNITNNRQGVFAAYTSDGRWYTYSRNDPSTFTLGAEYEF
jgi:hypothetical protein